MKDTYQNLPPATQRLIRDILGKYINQDRKTTREGRDLKKYTEERIMRAVDEGLSSEAGASEVRHKIDEGDLL